MLETWEAIQPLMGKLLLGNLLLEVQILILAQKKI